MSHAMCTTGTYAGFLSQLLQFDTCMQLLLCQQRLENGVATMDKFTSVNKQGTMPTTDEGTTTSMQLPLQPKSFDFWLKGKANWHTYWITAGLITMYFTPGILQEACYNNMRICTAKSRRSPDDTRRTTLINKRYSTKTWKHYCLVRHLHQRFNNIVLIIRGAFTASSTVCILTRIRKFRSVSFCSS